MGADWDGDVISKAWKLLQIHLRNKFPLNHQKAWECREAIVDTILKVTGRSDTYLVIGRFYWPW
ncbi:expressed protein [Phakopsora pachyrhizi]|uniref:Expressed protein n=1 Tax=Phakopsora pachyrhizi TaxID=170000 RepID=A0AAV0BAK7_PHAPC|nr:expressed protein [Phakopsora pachyrhizi]